MPETQTRREAPVQPPPEMPAESAASRAERQQLLQEAEMAVRQVEQGGLPVAEEIAAEHGATVPPTTKLKLLGLAQAARRALDYLKHDILKMPTAEVQALRAELAGLVGTETDRQQEPPAELLEKIRALSLRLAWADPKLAQESIDLTLK